MPFPIKTIKSVLKVLTNIVTCIIARPIGLVVMQVLISVSTFKTDVILYFTLAGIFLGNTKPIQFYFHDKKYFHITRGKL
jgi:hypothetical protein